MTKSHKIRIYPKPRQETPINVLDYLNGAHHDRDINASINIRTEGLSGIAW